MPATRPLKRRLDVGKFAQICVQRGHSIERRFVPGILPGLAVCQTFSSTRPLNRAVVCARHSAWACGVPGLRKGFRPDEGQDGGDGGRGAIPPVEMRPHRNQTPTCPPPRRVVECAGPSIGRGGPLRPPSLATLMPKRRNILHALHRRPCASFDESQPRLHPHVCLQ